MEDFNFVSSDMVIVGRKPSVVQEFGTRGTGFLGRVVLSKGESPVLGRKVLIDLATSHVILVLGKRGYGKSYTLGVLVEELASLPYSVKSRTAVIVIDTVGIFWTMKVPNKEQADLLQKWGLEPKGFDVNVLVPKAALPFYLEHEIPVDGYFAIKPSELGVEGWLGLFDLDLDSEAGSLLAGAVVEAEEKIGEYDLDDLIRIVQEMDASPHVKRSVSMRLAAAKDWGLFDKDAPKITEYAKAGSVNIIDVSTFKSALGGQSIREIVVAVIGKRIFEERMKYRKVEEIQEMKTGRPTSEMPLVWMIIDEAHLFMPKDRKSLAKDVLSDWIRVGRQPGLSLVLATQRVDRMSDDAITQADIIIGHRVTSYLDIQALSAVKPTYAGESLDKHLATLPHTRGLAVLMDDITEKVWVLRVRPRMSWHGGGSATALVKL
ncbi:MAG: hypothetical protein PWQ11_618 [Candidatus Diapherotrites archaeon]|nr:hypothetical protein [Candidatus Diapherotrites archaeon]